MNDWTQDALFEWDEPYVLPPFDFAPDDVEVRGSTVGDIRTLQGRMGKGRNVWKPSPGRHVPFTIHIKDRLAAIGLLSSCVLSLRARDQFLALPTDSSERGKELRHYMDLAVAIGAQPIAWHWNIGKLVALVAPTMGDVFRTQYGDDLKGVTTTSLWGKSSQYNRIYQFLGYTSGHGVIHVPQSERDRMREWCKVNAAEEYRALESRRRSNAMNVVQLYARMSGDGTWQTFHGQRRGIYYHPVVPASSRTDVIRAWYDRWGLPRWQRTYKLQAPYLDGTTWHKTRLTS